MAARRPAPAPAAGLFEFVGPYPVVLMDRALEVAPGDVVDWPAGPPDDVNWRPADPSPPAPPADGGDTPSIPSGEAGGAPEES